MELVITDKFGTNKIISNPQHIPRVGEHIVWEYAPSPKVDVVLHDFNGMRIIVSVS